MILVIWSEHFALQSKKRDNNKRVKQMKKTLQATVLGLSIAASGTAMAEFDKIRWQVPMGFPSSLIALGDTMPAVSEMLKDMSGGSFPSASCNLCGNQEIRYKKNTPTQVNQ